jgi:hypothetical protein
MNRQGVRLPGGAKKKVYFKNSGKYEQLSGFE